MSDQNESAAEARFRRYDAAGEASIRADLDSTDAADPETGFKRA